MKKKRAYEYADMQISYINMENCIFLNANRDSKDLRMVTLSKIA